MLRRFCDVLRAVWAGRPERWYRDVWLLFITGVMVVALWQFDEQQDEIKRVSQADIARAAVNAKHSRAQIIMAGKRAVVLSCEDANAERKAQRVSIQTGKATLARLAKEGAITAGLADAAEQANEKRLLTLRDRDCDERAADFEHTALNGRD